MRSTETHRPQAITERRSQVFTPSALTTEPAPPGPDDGATGEHGEGMKGTGVRRRYACAPPPGALFPPARAHVSPRQRSTRYEGTTVPSSPD